MVFFKKCIKNTNTFGTAVLCVVLLKFLPPWSWWGIVTLNIPTSLCYMLKLMSENYFTVAIFQASGWKWLYICHILKPTGKTANGHILKSCEKATTSLCHILKLMGDNYCTYFNTFCCYNLKPMGKSYSSPCYILNWMSDNYSSYSTFLCHSLMSMNDNYSSFAFSHILKMMDDSCHTFLLLVSKSWSQWVITTLHLPYLELMGSSYSTYSYSLLIPAGFWYLLCIFLLCDIFLAVSINIIPGFIRCFTNFLMQVHR